jgi:hypothetical protein
MQAVGVSWPYLTGIDKLPSFVNGGLCDLILLLALLTHRWALRWKVRVAL